MTEYMDLEPGRELDALVWQALNGQALNLTICRRVDGDIQPYAGYPVGHISPLSYSEDMNAALLALNNFTDVEIEKSGDNWSCLIMDSMQRITRKTAPHAISLAILTTGTDLL